MRLKNRWRATAGVLVALVCLALVQSLVPASSSAHVAVTVTVDPVTVTLPFGATKQFKATVSGAANTAVTWYVNNIAGGNATVGTIDAAGNYKAPAALPPGNPVTVKAVSVADPMVSGSGAVTVRYPTPLFSWWSPSKVPLGNATFDLYSNNNTFYNGAVVKLDGLALPTTFVSAGQLKATSNVLQSGSGYVTVTNPSAVVSNQRLVEFGQGIVMSVTPATATVATYAKQQFTATVTGAPTTQVYWGVVGGSANGTISSSGLYTAPNALPAGPVTVRAASAANSERQATATVTVVLGPAPTPTPMPSPTATPMPSPSPSPAPSPSPSPSPAPSPSPSPSPAPSPSPSPSPTPAPTPDAQTLAVGRFLDQATFGPTPALLSYVKQVGINQYLDEQFLAPESVYPSGVNSTATEMTDQFYLKMLNGPDQLRQRVLYALSEVITISRNKNYYPNMLIPWQQILSKHAFGNYKNLLKEITLDASMGNFLDMVNSTKPLGTGGTNENYARELLQLFSIGLYKLNPDGSQMLDASNKPIPTYNQTDVRQLALALTGWTFNRAGTPPVYPNPNYYPGPMYPLPAYHDTNSKAFLGMTLPANQTIQKDMDDVIDTVFNHPNVGPFICVRLMRALVTSNPSPAYVTRVVNVFNNNGLGVRGDLQAVIRAILLDADARNDNPPNDFGRLRTPVQTHIALMRALGGTITPNLYAYVYDDMGESILNAPSVFGHYSALYRIPKQSPPLNGPEFQIHGPGETVNSGNLLWGWMNYYSTGIWDLQWLFALGGNHTACINAVDTLLLYGRMSPGMRQALQTALQTSQTAGADAKHRAQTVLYLTALSSEYLVIR